MLTFLKKLNHDLMMKTWTAKKNKCVKDSPQTSNFQLVHN